MFSINRSFLLLAIFWALACGPKTDSTQTQPDLSMDNLYAWCIVPFDKEKRSPEERIKMLRELNFKRYVYDWRDEHIPEMAREWRLAQENDIEILGVWLWINAKRDQSGALNSGFS